MNRRQTVFSLYRSYVREIKRLPHKYLRLFFRIQVADDFRALLQTKNDSLQGKKLKRVSKGLRRLRAANAGDHLAFNHVLDLAYGRIGRLRWELMEPLLSDPNAPLPPPIIPGKEASRPPVYSPELTALLTSGVSRKTKPLGKRDLSFPPTLPERADPTSKDAALLGPLSKRREVNIRWRYFTKEWKKVLPPLEVSVADHTSSEGDEAVHKHVAKAGIRPIGFQNTIVLEELLELAGHPWKRQQSTRRRKHDPDIVASPPVSPFDGHLPTRWLRRRYQELLGRLPILTFYQQPPKVTEGRGRYDVSWASSALIPSRSHSTRLPYVGDGDMEWIRLAEGKGRERSEKQSDNTEEHGH
ncbi:hypothetical protein BV22DRAFT_1054706 [Leucogyrophana mollusca]|uniref:Uncharacterized protein n=1 Tax=Leucogyrophana mollusca TaxID=85980 RepID=A0ACB8BYF3_9AGAM|nr:hypothetical protein BV22DRAFT_1054706 [Leucogyrophana mollusca]